MVTYNFYLKIVATLSIRSNVTEAQIRSFLANSRDDLEAKINTIVSNAPPVAEAVLDNVSFKLKVNSFSPGLWEIYPKIVLTISVADSITELQVQNFLEGYCDQFKVVLRNLVASVPANRQAVILDWHVHRLSGHVDEVE